MRLEPSRGAVSRPEYHGPAFVVAAGAPEGEFAGWMVEFTWRTAIVTRHARRGDLEKERMDHGKGFEPDVCLVKGS